MQRVPHGAVYHSAADRGAARRESRELHDEPGLPHTPHAGVRRAVQQTVCGQDAAERLAAALTCI